MRTALAALVLTMACARGMPAGDAGGGLVGTEWRLQSIDGTPVLEDVEATLRFSETGRVAGNGSCNRFLGTVSLDGGAVKIGGLGTTRMACAEAVMRQEDRYLRALEGATRLRWDEQALTLEGGGRVRLRFVRR